MKRLIYILFASALFVACQKADCNGALDGYWKLLKIEDFAKDTVIDTKEIKRFWSIQLNLLATSTEADWHHGGQGRFQHVGDSLFVQMINIPKNAESLGLFNPEDERFEVVVLNKSKMILRSEYALLEFRKF